MNHPCITEVTTQLGNGVKEITGTPGYMSCGAAGVREPPNYEKAVRLGSEGGKESNQRQYYSTGGVRSTSPRATLTPAQRGRFWSSVGQAIEAVRAGLLQGKKRADR